MPKSKLLPWLLVLVVAGGIAIALRTGSVGLLGYRPSVSPISPSGTPVSPESGGGPGTAGGWSDRPHIKPGPQPIDPALRADQAKPRFTGPLGDFVISPLEAANFPPCTKPLKAPTRNEIMTSELFTPLWGMTRVDYVPPPNFQPDVDVLIACADGTLLFYGSEVVGKRYFVGPAKLAWAAPLDRLVLMTVAGYPAIAQLPIPGWVGDIELFVIQRFPSGDRPGILVADREPTLDEAVRIAEQLIGVRPFFIPVSTCRPPAPYAPQGLRGGRECRRELVSLKDTPLFRVDFLAYGNFDPTTWPDKPAATFGRTGEEPSMSSCDVDTGVFVCLFKTELTGLRPGDVNAIARLVPGPATDPSRKVRYEGQVMVQIAP